MGTDDNDTLLCWLFVKHCDTASQSLFSKISIATVPCSTQQLTTRAFTIFYFIQTHPQRPSSSSPSLQHSIQIDRSKRRSTTTIKRDNRIQDKGIPRSSKFKCYDDDQLRSRVTDGQRRLFTFFDFTISILYQQLALLVCIHEFLNNRFFCIRNRGFHGCVFRLPLRVWYPIQVAAVQVQVSRKYPPLASVTIKK